MSGPVFRRVVRANRLIAEGKCPGCEMDYKPQIAKLETELQDTRRALELMCIDYRSMEMADGVNKNLSTVEEYMGYARGERAER